MYDEATIITWTRAHWKLLVAAAVLLTALLIVFNLRVVTFSFDNPDGVETELGYFDEDGQLQELKTTDGSSFTTFTFDQLRTYSLKLNQQQTLVSSSWSPLSRNQTEVEFKPQQSLVAAGGASQNCGLGQDGRLLVSIRCSNSQAANVERAFTGSEELDNVTQRARVMSVEGGVVVADLAGEQDTLERLGFDGPTTQITTPDLNFGDEGFRLHTNPTVDAFVLSDDEQIHIYADADSDPVTYSIAQLEEALPQTEGVFISPRLFIDSDDTVYAAYVRPLSDAEYEEDVADINPGLFRLSLNGTDSELLRPDWIQQSLESLSLSESIWSAETSQGVSLFSAVDSESHLGNLPVGTKPAVPVGSLFQLDQAVYTTSVVNGSYQSQRAVSVAGLELSGLSLSNDNVFLSMPKTSWSDKYQMLSLGDTTETDPIVQILMGEFLDAARTAEIKPGQLNLSFQELAVGFDRIAGEVSYDQQQFKQLQQQFERSLRAADIDPTQIEINYLP